MIPGSYAFVSGILFSVLFNMSICHNTERKLFCACIQLTSKNSHIADTTDFPFLG